MGTSDDGPWQGRSHRNRRPLGIKKMLRIGRAEGIEPVEDI
jgi:hypothetical protein